MRIRSKLCDALEHLAKAAAVYDLQATEHAEINSRDLAALSAVRDGVETQAALAVRLGTSATYASAILQKLEARQLVVRVVVRSEKFKTVRLTKAGREAIDRYDRLDETCRRRLSEEYGVGLDILSEIEAAKTRRAVKKS